MFFRRREYNSPRYMRTISMNELYENVYNGRPPIVDGLPYAGIYLFGWRYLFEFFI